jgi:hypothetical protein
MRGQVLCCDLIGSSDRTGLYLTGGAMHIEMIDYNVIRWGRQNPLNYVDGSWKNL